MSQETKPAASPETPRNTELVAETIASTSALGGKESFQKLREAIDACRTTDVEYEAPGCDLFSAACELLYAEPQAPSESEVKKQIQNKSVRAIFETHAFAESAVVDEVHAYITTLEQLLAIRESPSRAPSEDGVRKLKEQLDSLLIERTGLPPTWDTEDRNGVTRALGIAWLLVSEAKRGVVTLPSESPRSRLPFEDVWGLEKFHNDKCSQASQRHGVGEKNGAYKDGWEDCWKWIAENAQTNGFQLIAESVSPEGPETRWYQRAVRNADLLKKAEERIAELEKEKNRFQLVYEQQEKRIAELEKQIQDMRAEGGGTLDDRGVVTEAWTKAELVSRIKELEAENAKLRGEK